MNNQKQQPGFVLLFALLIMSILFALGAGFLSTAQKESILSSTSTESQVALGAADTGIECALFQKFSSTVIPFSCAGHNNITATTGLNATMYPFDMVTLDPNSTACGIVSIVTDVARDLDHDGTPETLGTEIQSRGFNVCIPAGNGILTPNISDPLLIERKLVVWYPNPVATPPPIPSCPPTCGNGNGNSPS